MSNDNAKTCPQCGAQPPGRDNTERGLTEPEKKPFIAEAEQEFRKDLEQAAADLVVEANETKGDAADRIKHVLKRMGVHQLVLASEQRRQADAQRRTNCILTWLSIAMVVVAIVSVGLSFYVYAHPPR